MRSLFLVAALLSACTGIAQLPHQHERDSLKQVLLQQPADTGRVLSWLAFAATYNYNDERAGFPAIDSAWRLALQLHWQKGIARAEQLRGIFTGDTGNNMASNDHFLKALAIHRASGDLIQAAKDLSYLTRAYNRESDFPNALKSGLESVDIAESLHNDSLLANVLSAVTITYLNHKNYPKGRELALKGKALAEKVHSQGDLVDYLTYLAFIGYRDQDWPEVKALLHRALAIARTLGEPITVGSVLSQLGEAEKDSPSIALPHLMEARSIFAMINPNGMSHANALTQLGKVFEDTAFRTTGQKKRNLLDSAIAVELRAAAILQTSRNRQYLSDVYNHLAQYYSETGAGKKAYAYDLKAAVIYDSLFSQKKKDELARLQDKHDLDIRDKEILLHKLQAASQRKVLIGAVSGFLLLSVIGGMLYRQSRQRKQNNQTLLVLNRKLDEANKVKARFFGILSHDLRSPVANLLGFLHQMQNEPDSMSAGEQAGYRQQIGQSAEELLETMEAMLLWSKEQMDSFKPDLREIPVADLFAYLQKFFGQERQIALRFADAGDLQVSGDENYLRVIMQNLTSNAFKVLRDYPAGRVEWRVTRRGNQTILSITDNGPGLNKDQARALYTEDAGMNAGSGFGFHIIRDLARAIRYSILVDSEPGKGTTFALQAQN